MMKLLVYWLTVLLCGVLFGLGLTISGMIQPEIIFSFLRFDDFGLVLVLASASSLTLLVYQVVPRFLDKPLVAQSYGDKSSVGLKRTVIGAALFGVGWGLCGVCPGPAIAGLGAGNWPMLFAVVAMFAGAYVQGRWFGVAEGADDGAATAK